MSFWVSRRSVNLYGSKCQGSRDVDKSFQKQDVSVKDDRMIMREEIAIAFLFHFYS